jgi:outer membrane protein assembly factor BamB
MSGSVKAAGFALAFVLVASLAAVAAEQAASTKPQVGTTTAPAPAEAQPADYTSAEVGSVTVGQGKPSADTETWPQFRGANRDAIATAASVKKIYRTWPEGGPKVLWSIENLGEGYSGAAIFGGRVFFHDYDKASRQWSIRCVSLADGQEIWRWSYTHEININHGFTRTVPATDGKTVISMDPKLVLHAFDVASGKRLWAIDLTRKYGATIPGWYNGQCPLLEGDHIILAVGGRKVLMTALDLRTGKMIWETPNPHGQPAPHSSVMPFTTAGGEKEYVLSTLKGALGVRASDGALRWEALGEAAYAQATKKADPAEKLSSALVSIPWQPKVAQVPSPLDLGAGKLFLTTGYKIGSVALEIPASDPPAPKVLYSLAGQSKPADDQAAADQAGAIEQGVFETDCHTPLLYQGHLYAVDHGVDKHQGVFACLDPNGKILWRHMDVPLSLGTSLLADGLIFLEEGNTGNIRLIAADPAGYRELGLKKLNLGNDAWGPMAYANGKLVVRGLTKLVCLQVGE